MQRPVLLSVTVVAWLLGGCSRREPASNDPAKAETPTTLAAVLAAPAPPPVAPPAPAHVARSLAGKKVLHVGDSMVGGKFGLTRALEDKLTAEGASIVRHTQVSESLTSFDKGPTLRDLLRTHAPDIVIINLGANDTLVPFPSAYAHDIENIARRAAADGRECWWIGPPSWKGKDTGLVNVLRDNAGSCRFFDSTKLELDRASDGIHPNDRGAAKWAEAFWQSFRDPS